MPEHEPRDGPAPTGPDFGPRGYLPPRAAARARKIILRGPLGLQWVVASVIAGLALLAVGIAFLLVQSSPPGEPFVGAGALDEVDPRGAAEVRADGHTAVVVRAGGSLRAFASPETEVVWCAESRRLEAADGRVWGRDGRRVGGHGSSLAPLRVEVFDGQLYLDPEPQPALAPRDRGEQPACVP